MPNVSLGTYSTIAIAAASGVYRLTIPQGFTRNVDVMNTGAGAISLRADSVNPTVNDPNSLQLPSNWAANGIPVDGVTGLGIIAAADTTISVRVR